MPRLLQVSILVLLILCVSISASAQYTVQIGEVMSNCDEQITSVDITIEPDVSSPVAIGGFDLLISYYPQALSFAYASAGTFMEDCGWEYFTYRFGTSGLGCCSTCPSIQYVRVIALAETNNGPEHPSCYEPTELSKLFSLRFLVTSDPIWIDEYIPLNFYWEPVGNCADNSFSTQSGTELLIANSVVDHLGNPWGPGFGCTGPAESCEDTAVIPYINFHGGGIAISGDDDGSHRGDVNLDGIAYQISDMVLFSNYFIYGLGVFIVDIATQIYATDMNCDGITLSVADLVYGIRIVVGDAQPFCNCPDPSSPKAATAGAVVASISETDTLAFFGAEGWAGKSNVPFELYFGNSTIISGFQVRIEYDPAYLTPHFDPVIGDGESVTYTMEGLAAFYEISGGGVVKVKSVEPGELLIYAYPGGSSSSAIIPAKAGNIMKVYFDVNPPMIPLRSSAVAFVAQDYYYNLFADPYGMAILPTTVDGEFTVISEPSCPVLFSDNGTAFVQENPLLTACEASGYQDIVTDYYHVSAIVPDENGRVNFQLKELEDETTYLEEIELLTVDHSYETKIASSISGNIMAYSESFAPVSAIDHKGVDCLNEVIANDRNLYVSDQPGYMILQFLNNSGGKQVGYNLASALKPFCPIFPPIFFKENQNTRKTAITVEILAVDGNWVKWTEYIPTRVDIIDEIVTGDVSILKEQSVISVRVSWTEYYTTDRVHQIVMSDEQPSVSLWSISESEITGSENLPKYWSGSNNDETLILNQGDMIEFSFATDPVPAGQQRDYIIRATGRYQPNNGNSNNLPESFTLYAAYPNPFNPSTTISYELAAPSNVRVEILNLLGQHVTTLVDEFQDAGRQEVIWNATDANGNGVASGVYFYRLTTDSSSASKKMMLLK